MNIRLNIAALGRSKWYEYAVRFAFGGAVTSLAGFIAKRHGPEVGGLFLAFPAIFPATATLLESHEDRKHAGDEKQRRIRGRVLAGLDAAGAAMGSIGLLIFGILIWLGLPYGRWAWVLLLASVAWILAAVGIWWLRKSMFPALRRRLRGRRIRIMRCL